MCQAKPNKPRAVEFVKWLIEFPLLELNCAKKAAGFPTFLLIGSDLKSNQIEIKVIECANFNQESLVN